MRYCPHCGNKIELLQSAPKPSVPHWVGYRVGDSVPSSHTYLEYRRYPSAKFWEVWRVGHTVYTRYGKLGTVGNTIVKEFASLVTASQHVIRRTNEKKAKGYVERYYYTY